MRISPIILDIDGSRSFPIGAERIDLRRWQGNLRYSASFSDLARLESLLRSSLEGKTAAFLGSGDFHHLTFALLRRRTERNLHAVVFDNHPDNMIFPWGIHCGSWVYHAARLPNIRKISVIGITSGDVSGINLLQNHYSVLRSGKVAYYCFRELPAALGILSSGAAHDARGARKRWAAWLQDTFLKDGSDLYLSIDKDVLCPAAARSTWDQGVMEAGELLLAVKTLSPRVVAADIVGEPSSYAYRSPVKRFFTWLDDCAKNTEIDPAPHARINQDILEALRN